jgi:flavin reductase (DIM6/NTAB) family NADH-FMN oxidoreductase RutF
VKAVALGKVYQLIEPGPVVLLTTSRNGRVNVMTMSWHMMLEFDPPLIACVCSGANYSFQALRATSECVIAIPARKLAAKVVKAGNVSGRSIDKFKVCGLTPIAAAEVQAPLIRECFANIECKVADRAMVNRYNMFILEGVRVWVDPKQKNPKTIHHHGYGKFAVDGATIKLKSAKA